jgi:hypothetical protein
MSQYQTLKGWVTAPTSPMAAVLSLYVPKSPPVAQIEGPANPLIAH